MPNVIQKKRLRVRSAPGEPWRDIPAIVSTPGGVDPVDKTEAMTQPVGRDADGKLWTEPTGGGGAGTWSRLSGKPFERIGDTLAVTDGTLEVNIHEVSNDAGGLTTIIG